MNTKKIIITIVLLFSAFLINAQDKYEFMIIEFRSFIKEISVSINGKEYMVEKADYLDQEKSITNSNPFLNKVNDYQDKGWELVSFSGSAGGNNVSTHIAYLKKKKVDKK